MGLAGSPPSTLAAIGVVLFLGIGLHEYAHCKFADMAGDPTPRIYGRVTLDLTKHFELFGTIMMVMTMLTGYGIGWGKPAPIDASKMRNPRWDLFIAVAAGPISNVLQALAYGFFARILMATDQLNLAMIVGAMQGETPSFLGALVGFGIFTNLSLAFFNLIPLGPLDGHWLVGLLLPERLQGKWFLYSRQYGNGILLAIIILGQFSNYSIIGRLINPPVTYFGKIFLGVPINE